MSLDTSLENALKRLKMKSPGDSVEWTQIMIRMASIQIMMILAFILMTMMMKYLPLKQLEELGESTTPTPSESLSRFIPDRDQAELVYEAVANGEQVNPSAVNSRVDELSKVVNPYTVGLRTSADSTLKKEPSSEMKKCYLTWSILNTVVNYTENDKDSPYKEMNHSPIYSRFENVNDLITDKQSDL